MSKYSNDALNHTHICINVPGGPISIISRKNICRVVGVMASFKISLLILDVHTYNKFWQMSAWHPLSHTVAKLFMHSSILGPLRTAGSKPPPNQYTVGVYRSILLAVFRHIRVLKNLCGDIS